MKRLTPQQIETIKKHKPVFYTAQQLTGVPWEGIAACWYRESFSVTPPKTPGGPFQFDPPPIPDVIRDLLRRYTTGLTDEQKAAIVKLGVNDFATGAILCACWLRHKSRPVLTVHASESDMKDAFYGYNGRKWRAADNSPYVMNFYDEAHSGPKGEGMRIRGTIPSRDGKRRIWIDTTDQRPGALVVFNQLRALNL